MFESFDPYYLWLGVPPREQPPNYYRLLGVQLFEPNPDVIEAAADQRMAHLRTFQTGPRAALSQSLLNEVSAARLCLLNPQSRPSYDASLRQQMILAREALAPAIVSPAPEVLVPPPAPPPKAQADEFAWLRHPFTPRKASGTRPRSQTAVIALMLAVAAALLAGSAWRLYGRYAEDQQTETVAAVASSPQPAPRVEEARPAEVPKHEATASVERHEAVYAEPNKPKPDPRPTLPVRAPVTGVNPGNQVRLHVTAVIDGTDELHIFPGELKWTHHTWGWASKIEIDGHSWDPQKSPVFPVPALKEVPLEELWKAKLSLKKARGSVELEKWNDHLVIRFDDPDLGADSYDVTVTIPGKHSAVTAPPAAHAPEPVVPAPVPRGPDPSLRPLPPPALAFWLRRYDLAGATPTADFVRLQGEASLTTKGKHSLPLEITIVARTDGNNIRIGYGKSLVIWNWELDRGQLRVQRFDGSIATARALLEPNTWYRLTWLIRRNGMWIFVNHRQVYYDRRAWPEKEAYPLKIHDMNSTVDVRSVSIQKPL